MNYGEICSQLYGLARGIAVFDGYIYLVFERGRVVKIGADGQVAAMFGMSIRETGLWVRAAKQDSGAWLESIALDMYGNVYVLDVNSKRIHVLDNDLNYVSSWIDPEHPLGDDVRDINFVRDMDYMFVTSEWGFYVYKTRPGLAGINTGGDTLYPDLICEDYPGMPLQWSVIGSGDFTLKLESVQGGGSYILHQEQLSLNEKSGLLWPGTTAAGEAIPCGEYNFAFYLDAVLMDERPLELLAAPALTLSGEDNQIITGADPAVNFQLEPDQPAEVQVWISPLNSTQMLRCIFNRNLYPQPYSFTWDYSSQPNEYEDGTYTLYFFALPNFLKQLGKTEGAFSRNIIINNTELTVSPVINSAPGFNPSSPDLPAMTGAFSLNNGTRVSAFVLNENGSIIKTLYSSVYLTAGDKTILWDGTTDAQSAPLSGLYRFFITAAQAELNVYAEQYGDFFILDSSAEEVTTDKTRYYISPAEPSSIGIQDSLEVIMQCSESVQAECSLLNQAGTAVVLQQTCTLQPDQPAVYTWDGMAAGQAAADGLYKLKIEVVDEYANRRIKEVDVVVDNNLTPEGPGREMIISSGNLLFNEITNNLHNSLSVSLGDRFALVWEADDGDRSGIFGQMFDSAGNSLCPVFRINDNIAGIQTGPAVTAAGSGFIVAWLSGAQGDYTELYLQQFNSGGARLGDNITGKMIGQSLFDDSRFLCPPAVVSLADGFLVAWSYLNDGFPFNSD